MVDKHPRFLDATIDARHHMMNKMLSIHQAITNITIAAHPWAHPFGCIGCCSMSLYPLHKYDSANQHL